MNALDCFAQANTLMGQRRLGEAESLYRQAVQLQPGFADAYLNLGVALKSQGRLNEAEASYRQALIARPEFVEALNNLANVLQAQGRLAEAEGFYRRALALRPGHLEAHLNLSRILLAVGRLHDAEASSRRAVALRPDIPETHNSLGVVLKAQAQLDDAEVCYRRAIELRPDFAEALNNLANVFQQQTRYAEAEALYRHVLTLRPAYAEAHNNLGNCLQEQGRYREAESCYRRALEIHSGYVEAQGHLGAALKAQGKLPDAVAAYRQALELRPDYVVAHNNLAQLLIAQGDSATALEHVMQALAREDGVESRLLFMDCITRFRMTHRDDAVRATMIRALTVPWGQASSLARVGAEMVKLDLRAAGITSVAEPGASRPADLPPLVFGQAELAVVAADALFSALLVSAQLRDAELERFLVQARRHLLATAWDEAPLSGEALHFYSALAQQCFINEYVYFVEALELQRATALRDRLDSALAAGHPASPLLVFAVAAYFPLHSLNAAGRLLDQSSPVVIAAVVRQQVREPQRERELAESIPQLTPIDDAISLLVQQQYSENPYPRWISAEISVGPRGVNEFIRGCFPQAEFRPLSMHGPVELLVAGSGTGLQPIGAARRFREARVLAVDLSLPSLCYAKRKAEEMGLLNIEFAQADILKLGKCGRTFDVIESAGVLHHLASIDQGLGILISLLRPDGFMQLGLYSRIARCSISRVRAYIAERGVGAAVDDIRRCRKALSEFEEDEDLRSVSRLSDFFGTSTCRDLLFHVQETCIDLRQLKALLADNGLRFLGFDLDAQVKNAYQQCYPDDPAATDLERWHLFELDRPDTFIGMYQFWVQKAG